MSTKQKNSGKNTDTNIKATDEYIANEQGQVQKYTPTDHEKKHIEYIYKRRSEMYEYVNKLGLYNEWAEVDKLYENTQKEYEEGSVPTINLATEIELIETKGADEKKVMPEAVLVPVDEDSRNKIEAYQELIEYIKNKNQDDLKMMNFIDEKNIKGIALKKIYWKETWRDIKHIVKQEKYEDSNEQTIPKFKWKTHKVISYKDICIKNIPIENVLVHEDSTSLSDCSEFIELFYLDYEVAKEEYGNFYNFKFVKKGEINDEILKIIQKNKSIKYTDRSKSIDCSGMIYWNIPKDEYSIIINGVLLTQYDEQGGNPIPYKYFKGVPFVRGICRYMTGKRQFYPKGDVILVKRLKDLKNILVNAITNAVVTNSISLLFVTKEVKTQLDSMGTEWQNGSVIEVENKENSQAIRTVSVDTSGIREAMALIDKIDEYIITITGVDSRALLSTIQETATKTAVRQDTSLKRINAGIKLLEYEALHREMEIMLALIRQFYEEEEHYIDEGELEKDNPKKIKVSKFIPIKDKKYNWIQKQKPINQESITKLINLGIDISSIDNIFFSQTNSETGEKYFEFLAKNKFELKISKTFQVQTDEVKELLLQLFEESNYFDLELEEYNGKISQLEIKKELLETNFRIEIRSKGSLPYSELYEKEKINELADKLAQNPFVNQVELAREVIKANGLDSDKLIKSDQQIQMEAMQVINTDN